jgi:quercetin dioxygenase-like cupin family protein
MSHEGEQDPVVTDPDKYRVVFENDRVRVLEYRDSPGARTSPHAHPDSVMVTLSSFRRRLHHDGGTRDVEIPAGLATWLPAQEHSGENIGDAPTHTVFVELKEPVPGQAPAAGDAVGPDLA